LYFSDLASVLSELSSFPLSVSNFSRKKKKNELEAKYLEIQDAIKLFSRKKVFITP
jgi:hypothetical protein